MIDELLCNVHRVKIRIYFHFCVWKFSHEEFHSSLSNTTIGSYGYCFFSISMGIYYNELSEDP